MAEKYIDEDYVCEDYGEVQIWTQVKVTVPLRELDALVAVMSMINNNLMIEDYSDIDTNLKTCYGDLIDEKILNANKDIASVSVFIPSDRSYMDDLAYIRQRCGELDLHAEVELVGVNEEDWANSWKQYYKPIKIGEKIVICPAWERYTPAADEIVIRMDPGMAFGTGTHETTHLVMTILEQEIKGGERFLDVGCGSGILSICASKLGAKSCNAYDIDPVAVKVARENAIADGCDNITVGVSDLLHGVDLSGGKYDFCVANIVADIIIRMMPDIKDYLTADAPLILSGIIDSRADEVIACVNREGYSVMHIERENDWVALLCRRK